MSFDIEDPDHMLAAAPTPPVQEPIGMEPVAWLSPNGLTANTKHLFNGKPLYSAEQLAQVQRERDEALLLLKDHVALQLKYQRDRDELLEAAKTVANNIGEFACAMQTQNQADVLTKYASDIFAEIAKTEGRK